ncbi:MAG: hypothetical protein K2X48_08185 [Chitinophagaceae bacterium]|nr:hypothetical protein [Chitinophagaceae bacterium]
MKKILFFAVLITATTASIAQVRAPLSVAKGAKLIGVGFGGLSYTNSVSKTSYSNTPTVYTSDGNNFNLSVYPSIAWFVQDKLAIGGGVSVSFYTGKSKSSNTGSSITSENTYNQPSFYLSPYARLYFGGSAKGMPFVQANAQYGIYGGTSKNTSSTGSSSKTTTKPKGDWNAGASFGYEHFISDYVGFYGAIGFSYGSSKTDYEYKPSTGTGYTYTSEYNRWYVPVNVGLQVHLPKKK